MPRAASMVDTASGYRGLRTASVAFPHMPAARLPADPPRHLGGGNLRKFVRLPDEQGQEVVK